MGCAGSTYADPPISPPHSARRQQLPASCQGPAPQPSSQSSPAGLPRYSFEELAAATKGFAPALLLGEGGWGKVYKGYLRREAVAIKLHDHRAQQGEAEFQTEVSLLSRLRHERLLPLLGVCAEGRHRALVFTLMPGGSLRRALDVGRGRIEEVGPAVETRLPLPWAARLDIAAQAAEALAFLHKNGICHRDVSSSNYLLDAANQSRLCDFGLACRANQDGSVAAQRPGHADTVSAAYGYAAPEFHESGQVGLSSDTWAFGVVLLELLTGHRPVSGEHSQCLADRLFPCLADLDVLQEHLDGQLDRRRVGAAQLASVAAMAQSCLQPDPRCRPSMAQVQRALEAAARFKGEPLQLGSPDVRPARSAPPDSHELRIFNPFNEGEDFLGRGSQRQPQHAASAPSGWTSTAAAPDSPQPTGHSSVVAPSAASRWHPGMDLLSDSHTAPYAVHSSAAPGAQMHTLQYQAVQVQPSTSLRALPLLPVEC